jgi:hypothetical protein
MKRFEPTNNVTAGFYLNLNTWGMTAVPAEGGTLEGAAGDRFVRIPMLAMLVIAPLLGAVYAIFLPFIGFALLFQHLGRILARKGEDAIVRLGVWMVPEWQAGVAYLEGRARRGKEKESA